MSEFEAIAVAAAEILETVIEDGIAEGAFEESVAESLAELQSTIQTDLLTTLESGIPENEALSESYSDIFAINEDAANEWADEMTAKGYDFEADPVKAEEEDFEDTDPDSDPNKGDEETSACQKNPEDPECIDAKQGKLSRFFDFLGKAGTVGGTILQYAFPILFLFFYFFGAIAIALCKLWNNWFGKCKTPVSGQSRDQCDNEQCTGSVCNGAKTFIQAIRKYQPFVIIPIVLIGLFFTIYFKSSSAGIFFSILLGISLMMNTILGNLLATIFCNFNASYCIFSLQKINC